MDARHIHLILFLWQVATFVIKLNHIWISLFSLLSVFISLLYHANHIFKFSEYVKHVHNMYTCHLCTIIRIQTARVIGMSDMMSVLFISGLSYFDRLSCFILSWSCLFFFAWSKHTIFPYVSMIEFVLQGTMVYIYYVPMAPENKSVENWFIIGCLFLCTQLSIWFCV